MDFSPLFMSSWTVFKKRKQKYVCCNKIFTLISVQKKEWLEGQEKVLCLFFIGLLKKVMFLDVGIYIVFKVDVLDNVFFKGRH